MSDVASEFNLGHNFRVKHSWVAVYILSADLLLTCVPEPVCLRVNDQLPSFAF